MSKIKKIIGVASCKGGVGKSTLSINLAVAMSKYAKIGLLDADIHGPSHKNMLGLKQQHDFNNISLKPHEKFNIKSMSISYFLDKDSSVLLRGPMASNTIKHLIKNTQWGELDILLIDFPPGTGDIYLTLLRDFKFDGIILISTPQIISTIDVEKTIIMLKKFNIQILGLIENMAYYKCKNCKSINNLYGNNKNILDLIKKFNIHSHYTLEFNEEINESANNGIPFVLNSTMPESQILDNIATNILKDININ